MAARIVLSVYRSEGRVLGLVAVFVSVYAHMRGIYTSQAKTTRLDAGGYEIRNATMAGGGGGSCAHKTHRENVYERSGIMSG